MAAKMLGDTISKADWLYLLYLFLVLQLIRFLMVCVCWPVLRQVAPRAARVNSSALCCGGAS